MLRVLSLNDLDAAVEIQSTAFYDDPLWLYLVPDDKRRFGLLRKTFRPTLQLGILSQQTYGVGDPLKGIAVWSTLDEKSTLSTEMRLKAGGGLVRLLLRPSFLRLLPRALKIFPRFEAMQTRYAPDPHYYLQTISVSPSAQGQGLASQLIKPFLAKADAAGVSAYTETMTPSNMSLYEHYGFRTMEEYAVPNTDLKMWAFYREALTATT